MTGTFFVTKKIEKFFGEKSRHFFWGRIFIGFSDLRSSLKIHVKATQRLCCSRLTSGMTMYYTGCSSGFNLLKDFVWKMEKILGISRLEGARHHSIRTDVVAFLPQTGSFHLRESRNPTLTPLRLRQRCTLLNLTICKILKLTIH